MELNTILKHFESGLSRDSSGLSSGFVGVDIDFLHVQLWVISNMLVVNGADYLARWAPVSHEGDDERLAAVGSGSDRFLIRSQIVKV